MKSLALLSLLFAAVLLSSSCAQAWTVGPWNCVVRGLDATESPPEWTNEYVTVNYGVGIGQAVSSDQACALAVVEGTMRGLSAVRCKSCIIGACPKLRVPHGEHVGVAASADTCGGGGAGGGAGAGGSGSGPGGGATSTTSTTTGAGGGSATMSGAGGA